MATFTNTNKSSNATFTAVSRSSTTWDLEEVGQTWSYNEPDYTYNQDVDPVEGFSVLYNGSGTALTWTNVSKN